MDSPKPKNEKLMFSPATTMRAPEVIYDQIYQKIISGELRPGDRLPAERVLAEQFRRSRPSVREALRMLQQNGLIRIEPGRVGGPVVQGVSMESVETPLKKIVESGAISIQELVDYRFVNDVGCARLAAAYHTAEDAEELRAAMAVYARVIDDFPLFKENDANVHRILAKATHNSLIITISHVLIDAVENAFWDAAEIMDRDEIIAINQKAYTLHQKVVEAVLVRDPDLAEKYMRDINDVYTEAVL